jgi:mannose-6-phosphate isomerase-like protein (cupin superfamily)
MSREFPSADDYASEQARHVPMTVVDILAEQAAVTESYRNQVLLDINHDCLRLSVFEGEYRWHHHPDSDELFVVVQGELQIEFKHRPTCTLKPMQCLLVPAGTVHRTRAIGRTVNLTFEKQAARTVFADS